MSIYIRVIIILFLVMLAEAFVDDTLFNRIVFFILIGSSMASFASTDRKKYELEVLHAISSKKISWTRGVIAGIVFLPLNFFMLNAPFFEKSSIWIEVAIFTAVYLELHFLILMSVARVRVAYRKEQFN